MPPPDSKKNAPEPSCPAATGKPLPPIPLYTPLPDTPIEPIDCSAPYVTATLSRAGATIPQVATTLSWRDHLGTVMVRCRIGRSNYRVTPGLYAVGNPDETAPVLVTANYKLSFDHLRSQLGGIDASVREGAGVTDRPTSRPAWILVLDTKGINVWCAAGKGTFGTDELVRRIRAVALDKVVTHRTLIVPQLGAPGIAAQAVKKTSGFRLVYGPVMARDLPAFLDGGLQATAAMRRKEFPLAERLALIPVEWVAACQVALLAIPPFFFFGGLASGEGFWSAASRSATPVAWASLLGAIGGTILTPALLPYLPGRAFALKGFWGGVGAVAAFAAIRGMAGAAMPAGAEMGSITLLTLVLASYFGMNFTGSSTYTSLAGVKKEMRVAVPLQLAGLALGLLFWGFWTFF